ncbi:hypothetical protein V495_04814 [Pseudogymnoascus sp. VKM F-4514 (FW-929)]|nr:hypothetical protein V495_04814 [Pseudogymnoascus sp. VKM F-4514 (FW-929)]KFY51603.1 hypothetical protein V497_08985 [Pseudogymnoascus sp. VKM F-4516 (FW-969)]
MNVRLAACEPCRSAKLACGHERPACVRCRGRGQGEDCTYRTRPFKRRRLQQAKQVQHQRGPSTPEETPISRPSSPSVSHPPPSPSPYQHRYPNPGFLGSYSHSTIFSHVSSRANNSNNASLCEDPGQMLPSYSVGNLPIDKAASEKGIYALSQLELLKVSELKALVEVWLSKDVNLPLAGPFVSGCAQAVLDMVERSTSHNPQSGQSRTWVSERFDILLKNSLTPIVFRSDSSVADFVSQFYGDNVRWETLGIFSAAATRATLDLPFFPQLYSTEQERRKLIMTLTRIGDRCLEACLGLDCLNDLQLILQYENFIIYSQVYGDQSYRSWRRMGDLASSLFALGYHENIDETPEVPSFVAQLRKTAFARIYAADKSLAIFLGRPPRIIRTYCHFQLPSNIPGLWDTDSTTAPTAGGLLHHDIPSIDQINYIANTRWAAMCASVKEEILELFRDRDPHHRTEQASIIRSRAEEQWQTLPPHFKLMTSLKDCHLGPFERDFLAGARLDHLHIRFLLCLVSLRHISEPDDSLLEVAFEMLSLVVETIVLRERLVNSGTSLIWKVSFYGLPAAGIISLALLNPSSSGKSIRPLQRSKMLQDLSVLVAEVRTGAFIQAGEPNFALFTRATQTIQILLNILMGGELAPRIPEAEPTPLSPQNLPPDQPIDDWDPWINNDPWEFEIDFWANLAEHPSLQG